MHMKPTSRPYAARRTLALVLLLGSLVAVPGCFYQASPQAEFTATPWFNYPPLSVAFDARASTSPNGSIDSYDWSFGDGEFASGVQVSHTYPEKGVYPVSLTIKDAQGKTATCTHTVQALNRLPHAAFSYSPYQPPKNSPVTFNGSASYDQDGTIQEWIWTFDDGTTDSGETITHVYSYPRTYRVRLTVIDEDGGSGSVESSVIIYGCPGCG